MITHALDQFPRKFVPDVIQGQRNKGDPQILADHGTRGRRDAVRLSIPGGQTV